MEFFRIVKTEATEQLIQDQVSLNNLDNITNELFCLSPPENNEVKIGGIWGEFTLNATKIMGGVRFSMTDCPNALCWTVTTGYPPARDSVVIHLTINRERKQPEFIEEIEEFLSDHTSCLLEFLSEFQPSN